MSRIISAALGGHPSLSEWTLAAARDVLGGRHRVRRGYPAIAQTLGICVAGTATA